MAMDEPAVTPGSDGPDVPDMGQLFDRFAPLLWQSVRRLTGAGEADVDDIVQEVFLQAARTVRSHDPARGSIQQWLHGIVHHLVARHWRQRRREVARAREWLERHPTALLGQGDLLDRPDSLLWSMQLVALVRATLAELPAQEQYLLVHRYLESVPPAALAKELQCSPDAMRQRLGRARRSFLERIQKRAGLPARELRQ
jgi:RNA polymerase sigma factor (sigma-70 family)